MFPWTAQRSRLRLPTRRSCTSRRMIPGLSTAAPLLPGRDGTRIPEFGTTEFTLSTDTASASDSSAASAGAGATGDSIGTTTTPFITTTGTTLGARRFTTATPTTEGEARAVARSTVPALLAPGLSMATARPREDTRNRAVRAGPAPAPSAAMAVAEKNGVTLRAEAPALAEEAGRGAGGGRGRSWWWGPSLKIWVPSRSW